MGKNEEKGTSAGLLTVQSNNKEGGRLLARGSVTWSASQSRRVLKHLPLRPPPRFSSSSIILHAHTTATRLARQDSWKHTSETEIEGHSPHETRTRPSGGD